jgi:hypothetical protein
MQMKISQIIFLITIFFLVLINISFLNAPARERNITVGECTPDNFHPMDFDTIRTDLNQYTWPTDASVKITSSFAEYRSTHFHGGIDISTNGQTGYKVFAVQDGYVYRIRITPNGYGKMLFVKHLDGYASTYAHLRTFNDLINKAARDEQYRKGTYSIDLLLDSSRIPVKKGDVIAFTGETGFGPPHLHFELRDENLNPVNPLLSQNFAITDNIPPKIRRVMIEPLTNNSTVDNSSTPRYFSRFPRNRQALLIPQPIRVHGQIGFAVDADDKNDGTWSETGIHRMEFYLDDSLAFSMELNRVPAEETKEILLHYAVESILEGKGKFQKLFIDRGNSLPFYNHEPEGTGIINTEQLAEGKHSYKIVCMDIQGNSTELNGTMIANHKPVFQIASYDDTEIILTGDHIESTVKFLVFGKRAFQPNWTQHTLTRGRFEFDEKEIKLPVNTKPYDVIKIIAETKSGSESSPLYHFTKKQFGPARDIHIKTDVLTDYVSFTVTTPGVFTEIPELIVQEGSSSQSVILHAYDISKYIGAYFPLSSYYGKRIATLNAEINGKPVSSTDEFTIYPISPNKSGKFTTDDGGLIISYDSGAVYKPLYLQIMSDNNSHSIRYTLEPQNVLLNRGIKFSIPIEKLFKENHWGLYYRGRAGWIFQTSTADEQTNTFSIVLDRMLGELSLFRDDVPPTIGRLRAHSRSGKVFINFRYYDNLSGVDTDEIKLYINDKLVIPEIDGEHHRVWYEGEEKLDPGKHSLKIILKDKAKNETSLSRTITVR